MDGKDISYFWNVGVGLEIREVVCTRVGKYVGQGVCGQEEVEKGQEVSNHREGTIIRRGRRGRE